MWPHWQSGSVSSVDAPRGAGAKRYVVFIVPLSSLIAEAAAQYVAAVALVGVGIWIVVRQLMPQPSEIPEDGEPPQE